MFCPILNLQSLNPRLSVEKFMKETLVLILRDVRPGALWFHYVQSLCVYPGFSQDVLEVCVEILNCVHIYQLKMLSFSLTTAPRGFAKMLTLLAAHLPWDYVYVPIHICHLPRSAFSHNQ